MPFVPHSKRLLWLLAMDFAATFAAARTPEAPFAELYPVRG